jgi:hypothetical protein
MNCFLATNCTNIFLPQNNTNSFHKGTQRIICSICVICVLKIIIAKTQLIASLPQGVYVLKVEKDGGFRYT